MGDSSRGAVGQRRGRARRKLAPTFEPLIVKLDSRDRPRPATTAGLFFSLLVLVAAVVSVYEARELGGRRADWVSFVSPALVGLAAAQIGIWLVALVARLAVGSARLNRGLGWFLTLRRLTRSADSVSTIRIVVAAVVVAGVAGSAWVASDAWRDEMARMRTGGPVAFTVPAGGLQAYVASHRADPQGRWLMAMAASPDPSGAYRGVFVDTPRWDRVVGSFFAGTPVGEVSHQLDALAPSDVVQATRGSSFSVMFTAESVRRTWPSERIARTPEFLDFVPLQFIVSYVDSRGENQDLYVPEDPGKRPAPVRPGVVGYSAPIPGCARACAIEVVQVQGATRDGGRLLVTGMSFGDMRLVPPAGSGGLVPAPPTKFVRAVASERGLALRLAAGYTPAELLHWEGDATPAALVTPGLRLQSSAGEPQAYGLDGQPRPVEVTGEVSALPLLGRVGVLLDLGTALRGARGQIPQTHTVVVARADTPGQVLQALTATGAVGQKVTVEQTLASIRHRGTAEGTLLFALIAIFGLLIAAVSVVSATAVQRRARRREAASLRVVGVDGAAVTRGYRGEAEVLGAAVAVVAGLAVWIGCHALLSVLPLVGRGEFELPFHATPRAGLVVGLAVVAGAFVALVIFSGLRLVGRSSPPILLREDA